MITEKDVCCIIPYRAADEYRKNNINCSTKILKNDFPQMDIFVVEQDEKPILNDNDIFKTKFLYNPGLFNKSWALNIGINSSDKEYCLLFDADLIIQKEGLEQAFSLIDKFEVVKPFSNIFNLTENQSKNCYTNEIDFNNVEFISRNDRLGPIAGGIILTTKTAMNKVGLWHEGFQGYGAEDDAQSIKVNRFLSHITLPFTCLHLYHSRSGANDYINHSNYQNNIDLFYKIHAMNNVQLIEEMEKYRETNGNINKYRGNNE